MWCGCNKNGPRFNHCEPSQLPLGGFVICRSLQMRPDSGSGSVRKNHQTGVILNASVLKDLARTAVPVHIRCAPDSSKIRMTPPRNGEIQIQPSNRIQTLLNFH